MHNQMMIPADGRAYGVVSGMRRGFNGKRQRLHYSNPDKCEGTSPNMLITYADGTQTIVPVNTRGRVSKSRTGSNSNRVDRLNKQRHTIFASDLAPIGNID